MARRTARLQPQQTAQQTAPIIPTRSTAAILTAGEASDTAAIMATVTGEASDTVAVIGCVGASGALTAGEAADTMTAEGYVGVPGTLMAEGDTAIVMEVIDADREPVSGPVSSEDADTVEIYGEPLPRRIARTVALLHELYPPHGLPAKKEALVRHELSQRGDPVGHTYYSDALQFNRRLAKTRAKTTLAKTRGKPNKKT